MSPWWVLAGFAVVGLLAAAGGLPAPIAAALVSIGIGVTTIRHPANGLAALLLVVPFLLGEPKTRYFLLEPILVALVLGSFLGHWLLGRVRFLPSHGAALLAFVAAAVLALPLDLRDLLEDLWLLDSLDWSTMLTQGIPDISHLKYLERVLVLGLGTGLLAVAAQPAMGAAVVRALPALAAIVLTLTGFGLLRFFGVIHTAGQYLTLSFWTWQRPDLRLTAVAWNPDYLALFLVLVLPPLAALALPPAAPRWRRALGVAAAGLGSLALVFTFQRAAYLAALVAFVTLGLLVGRRPARDGHRRAVSILGAVVLAILAAVMLDAFVLHGRVAGRLARFADDPNRLRLWQTALRMALDHPLLGVGTGRYAFFFHQYAGALRESFGPFWGTAHSLYLHLLAEQGLVGLASFAALFGGIWLGALRSLPRATEPSAVLLSGVVASLTGWLAYGAVQFTFRVNALFYLACILTGTAAALAPAKPRPVRSPRWALTAVALGLVCLGLRAEAALERPVSPGYEAGFYRWERQPDGSPARWTGPRAALTVPIRGRVMLLAFRAPIPDIASRPQTVQLWVDRRLVAVLRLTAAEWQTLEVPLGQPVGAHALVEVETGHSFVPSRLSPSRDDRRLGVMMGEIRWRDP